MSGLSNMPYAKTDDVTLHVAIPVPSPIEKARMVRAANIEGRSLNNWFRTSGWKALEKAIEAAEESAEDAADRRKLTEDTAREYLERHMGRWRKGHETRKKG